VLRWKLERGMFLASVVLYFYATENSTHAQTSNCGDSLRCLFVCVAAADGYLGGPPANVC